MEIQSGGLFSLLREYEIETQTDSLGRRINLTTEEIPAAFTLADKQRFFAILERIAENTELRGD